ncbi:MAG: membrane protein insertion efficiency factor YidD [Candidatus Marinimicrobia bacterium]|nr:membrane protein insertion efficiency factor YidD [Candidatus Neomarinimicrobiota bacterium]
MLFTGNRRTSRQRGVPRLFFCGGVPRGRLRAAVLLAGLLLASAGARGQNLAEQLWAEGDYRAARREARRILLDAPEDTGAQRILAAGTQPATRAPHKRRGLAATATRLLVAFYRAQISPAIGARCVLHPSCSAYFVEAGREQGWLALPLMGDRAVREPGVVSAARQPVLVGGHTRYADPLSDHVFWHHAGGEDQAARLRRAVERNPVRE